MNKLPQYGLTLQNMVSWIVTGAMLNVGWYVGQNIVRYLGRIF